MSVDWELSDLQQQARAKRAEVERWEQILAGLDRQYALAADAEGAFRERRDAIGNRMGAIRATEYPARLVDGRVVNDVPPEAIGEYRWLEQQLRAVESERQRWLDDRVIRWSSGGLARSYSLSISSVDAQRGRVRVALGVTSSQLAALEDRLTAGEVLQTGATAPDYAEHRQRVEALRSRLA